MFSFLGNLENPRFQNYPQLGTILEASSKPRTPGNTFVDSEMNIAAQNGLDVCEAKKIESTDLFKCGSKFSDSSCTNLLNSYIIPTIEATSKEKGNYFSAHNNREVEEKNNIISDIENKSLKFEMKKTNHNFMKGYYLPLLETNELKINKSNHNIKKGRNINCVYDNIEEELSIKQSKRCKCHSSNISETKEKVLYNQRQSSTDQMEKERYTQTHSNKLSDNFTGSFSTAQSNYRSKQSTNMKSKTNKSRHFVCSVACEHNLSDVMEKLQTSFSSKKKCDEFISGRENSSMSTLIQDYFNDFSSSSDSSLDECCESIFEPSLTCADDVQNIIEGSETRFQRKKLHEQFDSDHVSDTSLNTASWMNNEDRVTEQPSTSIIDNYVSICEEKCKHFSNEHPSSASTFNQKQNLTEIFNVDVDNVPVSFKSNNQSLNTEKTMNYVLSPMDEDVQAISTQPENYNDWGGETKISNEFTLVGNNTFKFSNEILSLIKDNFTQHTKSDYILHHVKNSFIQSLLLEVHQRSYLSNFTSYDLICGAILCQPLLKLISEDLHNKHKTILTSSNEQNQNNKTCINENLYNISSDIIIHEDNVEACHSEQPQLTKQTNDTSNSESFPQVNCFLESAEGQEKSESVLFYPIINKVYEKNELYRDNSKSVSKCIEIPIYDDDDALNTGNSWDSKYTTISRKLPKFSENSDTEDVALTDNELLGNQYPISKIIPPVGKAFPNSQCNYSDASSVPIHFELVKRKLEVASNNEATSDFERRCVNNNSDDSYIKQTNTPYLIRELPTSDQLTDSIPSKDNKVGFFY